MWFIVFLLGVLVVLTFAALIYTLGLAMTMFSGAPYVPTPKAVARAMCLVGDVTEGDRVLDLGCGDASILIEAVRRHGAIGIGVELNPLVAMLARWRIRRAGLKGRIEIIRGNMYKVELPQVDLVMLYLLPKATNKTTDMLRERYKKMKIVSHGFEIDGLDAVETKKAGRTWVRRYEW